MVPIPNDKRKLACASDNFKAITLSSIVAYCLMLLYYPGTICACNIAFVIWKQKICPLIIAHVMMETICRCIANGSNVYALMLDSSNIFDRVNYCKLFIVLLKRKFSLLL